jgi:predicted nucleotidyltransferase
MRDTLRIINELKEKGLIKDYAIGGAIAALRWVEPFFTRDLDIFIIPEKEVGEEELLLLSPIYEYLKNKGYNQWVGQWLIIEGVPVEFIPAEGLAKEALENAIEIEFDGVPTKIIAPEYLIALFLKASRQKDKIKIQMLLEQAKIDMGKLEEILDRYNLSERFKIL